MRILPKEGANYTIKGDDIQIVEIRLDGETPVVAESGSLVYMSEGVKFEAKTGGKGFFGSLGRIIKRKLAGESAFLTYFFGRGIVGLSSDKVGKVVAVELEDDFIYAQKDAFLCAVGDVDLDIALQRKLSGGFFGGEGFILEKIHGRGIVFLNATGYLEVKELNDETIYVETAKAVAWSDGIEYSIELVSDLKTALFGDVGLFLTRLSGTGIVVIQSVDFEKFKREILKDIESKID